MDSAVTADVASIVALAAAAGSTVTALGGYGVARVKAWADGRRAKADERVAGASTEAAAVTAAASVRVEEVRAEVPMSTALLARLTEQDNKIDELRAANEEQRIADRAECLKQRREDRAACEEEIEQVRAEISVIATRAEEQRRLLYSEDDTGVHELQVIARRTTTPTPRPLLPPPLPRGEE